MKKNTIIVLFLAIALIFAFSFKSNAQLIQKMQYGIELDTSKPEVIADETTINDNKTGAVIKCSNDTVHFKIYQKWQHAFKRYSWVWKKHRHGIYKEYSITVSRKDGELIRVWAKNNL